MTNPNEVARHYHSGHLLKRISDGCAAMDLTPPFFHDALAPVDEFHIGGRLATEPFVNALDLTPESQVVDLGCGLGGPARYIAATTGANVTGIDLTAEFVETGRALTEWTGLSDRVQLIKGNVLDLPLEAESFDAAYMIHVGMNIEDKVGVAQEAKRVLKPGGIFAIYDVMQVGEGHMDYPAPWASSSEQSALARPETYEAALKSVGFEVSNRIDRTAFAKQFFADLAAAQRRADGPPPLGLHLIMGDDTALKIQHMVRNIEGGLIAPIEIHARLPV
ncbi:MULTISPECIES: class I SAM-dependent methyltransferase [unclassified Ruegeria]|uniref:class I SAM-dependent methyltransferase n=1 Tax=unclassified Ruegeria TaxID=2625375 RepID=UPI001490D675|nr:MULTISPECIES: class I SAM-dependent methyltransferase [unclassified Ruegeria]NOD48912.1 methyltransferase domain-containing protein [Ruegeria sp. HKCCD5849]NOD53559.1 methyltransferase domain-containing protein [Ruegeria sp. HKCCD5851]NOD69434.1 methyltransferase domain-containing protein [Ruegeria sp. HKCCD7303]